MRYEDYRRCGHGWFTAATLAVHPAIFYGGIILVGVLIAVFS